jgi:hypothetical protein
LGECSTPVGPVGTFAVEGDEEREAEDAGEPVDEEMGKVEVKDALPLDPLAPIPTEAPPFSEGPW